MRKQTLLKRLVAALATNEGVQPKRTEIWRRLESLTPREVDVLCYVFGRSAQQRDRIGIRYYRKNDQSSSRANHEKAWCAINCSIIPDGIALHSLPCLAEIQTPSREAQKATAGESVGFPRVTIAGTHRKRALGHPSASIFVEGGSTEV